tara:strand:- start:612 stop:926 length:315 start_codon:yes stop_codon:yes gene_type:complete
MTSGCILLAEEKENTIGMLIAGIAPDPWLPEVKTLREVAWWVDEEYRLTTAGYKLLLKYIELGNKLQDEELICGFTLTNMEQSPDFNLEKRGWRPIEKNYIYEG